MATTVKHIQEKSAPTFEGSLETLGARRVFDKLVTDGVNSQHLKYWLRFIANEPEKYAARKRSRRKAAGLARSARKLATDIEAGNEVPPMMLIATVPDLDEMNELPKTLRRYAGVWELLLAMPAQSGQTGPRTESIHVLLDLVKWSTGSYHYKEVADLLNVMDRAFGRPDTRWDVTNLKQLEYRGRKRLAKFLKD